MPKFAANLSTMFTEWAFLDRFQAAAETGFSAVEFLFPYDFPPDEIANRLSANDLTLALFNLPPGDWSSGERGLAALPERRTDFQQTLATAMPYVIATGAKRLHMMGGLGDRHDRLAMATYKDSIRLACDSVGESIDILIEPLNPRDMPGYFLNDFPTAAAIITDLALPNLKLQYDIYHRQILHGDVTNSLEKSLPMTGHIQIASVPNRQEPGTGELDDHRVFQHLDHLGYNGFIGCEYRPAEGTLAGLGWLKKYR